MEYEKRDINERFAALYAAESDGIFRFCLMRTSDPEVAKDLMQDVFVSMWKVMARDEEIHHVRAFLFKIARNRIIDWHRKKKAVRIEDLPAEGRETDDPLSLVAWFDATSETESEARLVIEMMRKLPDHYSEVLYMRFVEDMGPAQIAEVLDEPPNAISVRIHRGLEKLRSLLHHDQ